MSDNPKAEWTANLYFNGSRHTLQIAQSVPEENYFKQLGEGKAHPAWLIGHLAFGCDTIVRGFGLQKKRDLGKEWTKAFAPDFAGGNPISSNPSDYPSWDEIIKAYDSITTQVRDEIAALADADFDKSLKGIIPDDFLNYFPDVGLTIFRGGIDHDAYHRGQVALINKH